MGDKPTRLTPLNLFVRLVSEMSPDTFFAYLSEEDIRSTLSTVAKNKTKEQLQQMFFKELKEKKISFTKARNLWIKAMKKLFYTEFQRFYHFTPTNKFDTSTKLKNELSKIATQVAIDQEEELGTSSVVKLNSSPLHYLYVTTLDPKSDFQELLKTPLDSMIILSILPKNGVIAYWPTLKDKKYKFVQKLIKAVFKGVDEITVNALLLRKYAVQENITKLGISTPQEIAGFAGLDVIEFKGSNVMLGLSGLKRRHDANVDVITRVGPFTEIESDIIRIVCGKGVQIKSYEGIEALLRTLKAT